MCEIRYLSRSNSHTTQNRRKITKEIEIKLLENFSKINRLSFGVIFGATIITFYQF
jgi:hypothetical protein